MYTHVDLGNGGERKKPHLISDYKNEYITKTSMSRTYVHLSHCSGAESLAAQQTIQKGNDAILILQNVRTHSSTLLYTAERL